MASYQYKAVNMSGRTVEGLYEGQDRAAVAAMLRAKSYFPLEIAEVKAGSGLNRELGTRIPLKVLALFCQQFSTILSAGISVGQALDILAKQTENKRLQAVLKDVYEKVQTGRSLSDAFGEHAHRFPQVFMSMISVGEISGTLEASLKRLHGYFRQESTLMTKFRTSMIYPTVVLSLTVLITVFLLVFIVPTFEGIFANAGAQLPAPTRLMLAMSGFMRTQYPVILIAAVAAGLLFWAYRRSDAGRLSLDRLKLRIPAFGPLLTKLMISRFTRTLSAMSASGVPLTQALDITARVVTNKYIEGKLRRVSEAVREGSPLHKPLADITELPPMVQNMTRLGEESGTLDFMLEQTSLYYDTEAETAITRLMALVEPAIIVVMAGIILFVVLSVLLPTFSMASVVGGMGG